MFKVVGLKTLYQGPSFQEAEAFYEEAREKQMPVSLFIRDVLHKQSKNPGKARKKWGV
ncbi:MAG: hypothetical protein KO464_02280 [Candidatus Methanofastidiosum sp.]|nr:hypothetical protein [Methanofastidiosum sp.]